MSYDLYCYKPKSAYPNLEEAISIIEIEESDQETKPESDPRIKSEIVNALTNFNPKLEKFEFDFDEIARTMDITLEQAKHNYNHIELNSNEEDLATQLIVSDKTVWISVPYWYEGSSAEKVFDKVESYTKTIRNVAGYFVCDFQSERAYDPLEERFEGLSDYLRVVKKVGTLEDGGLETEIERPWWKFW